MLEAFVWFIIIVLFLLSFAGIIYPLIPSPIVLWIGFLLYHFFLTGNELTPLFWGITVFFTVILILSDIIANSYFIKKFGGSKWGEAGAAIAIIVGSFIVPPFGILIVPFLTVFVIEVVQKRELQKALQASFGSFVGFLSGAFSKVIILLVMIFWFILVII